jgi:hypothetical protein
MVPSLCNLIAFQPFKRKKARKSNILKQKQEINLMIEFFTNLKEKFKNTIYLMSK